jgi:Membrane proteins related to metalloendopeptidases
MVKINHDYGCEICYGHNPRLLVHQGETVKKGQVISLSGNTGESTGPHVHYEVRINGKPVNPVSFLKE